MTAPMISCPCPARGFPACGSRRAARSCRTSTEAARHEFWPAFDALERRVQLDGSLAIQTGVDQATANILYQQFYNNEFTWLPAGMAMSPTDDAGMLARDFLAAIQRRELNSVRELAGDPGEVTLDPGLDAEGSASGPDDGCTNDALNHYPPSTWVDYTQDGAAATAGFSPGPGRLGVRSNSWLFGGSGVE